jgi:hypothetical protein
MFFYSPSRREKCELFVDLSWFRYYDCVFLASFLNAFSSFSTFLIVEIISILADLEPSVFLHSF